MEMIVPPCPRQSTVASFAPSSYSNTNLAHSNEKLNIEAMLVPEIPDQLQRYHSFRREKSKRLRKSVTSSRRNDGNSGRPGLQRSFSQTLIDLYSSSDQTKIVKTSSPVTQPASNTHCSEAAITDIVSSDDIITRSYSRSHLDLAASCSAEAKKSKKKRSSGKGRSRSSQKTRKTKTRSLSPKRSSRRSSKRLLKSQSSNNFEEDSLYDTVKVTSHTVEIGKHQRPKSDSDAGRRHPSVDGTLEGSSPDTIQERVFLKSSRKSTLSKSPSLRSQKLASSTSPRLTPRVSPGTPATAGRRSFVSKNLSPKTRSSSILRSGPNSPATTETRNQLRSSLLFRQKASTLLSTSSLLQSDTIHAHVATPPPPVGRPRRSDSGVSSSRSMSPLILPGSAHAFNFEEDDHDSLSSSSDASFHDDTGEDLVLLNASEANLQEFLNSMPELPDVLDDSCRPLPDNAGNEMKEMLKQPPKSANDEPMSLPQLVDYLQKENKADLSQRKPLVEETKKPKSTRILSPEELTDIIRHVNKSEATDVNWDAIARMMFQDTESGVDPLRPFHYVEFAVCDLNEESVSSISLSSLDQ